MDVYRPPCRGADVFASILISHRPKKRSEMIYYALTGTSSPSVRSPKRPKDMLYDQRLRLTLTYDRALFSDWRQREIYFTRKFTITKRTYYILQSYQNRHMPVNAGRLISVNNHDNDG